MKQVSIIVPVYHNELDLPAPFPRLFGLANADLPSGLEAVIYTFGEGAKKPQNV
jgi:hypothetical protein